ncbi:hypothetical protein L6164_017700 [Bauhinia variegata]|uniref:Uncharacterized protein n=1 Tax=Bauhinia variegata TaxID=167791 RepID=A0ACB9N9X7_BAUVA|nr:hypothetical protein L6164_017700 [Bauhinia variegata]
MTENPEAHVLLVYLPGFTKERVRITYVNSSKTLRVTGERPIGGNKWSRFNKEFHVLEDSKVEKLQGKFDKGILTITMPKKIPPQDAQKSPSPSKELVPEARKPEKAQEMLPPKSATDNKVEEPADKKSVAQLSALLNGTADKQRPISDMDQQKVAEEKGLRALIPSEPKRESKPQKVKEETEQKPTLMADARKQIDGRKKGQEQIEPKPTLVDSTREVTGEKPLKGTEEFNVKPKLKLSPTRQTEEKPQKGQDEFGVKLRLKPPPPKKMDERVQKGSEETSQRTSSSTVPRKQTEEKTIVGDAEKERVTRKKEVEGSHGEPSESRKPEKGVEKSQVKEKERKEKYYEYPAKVAGPYSPPKSSEREKETTGKAAADEGKQEEDMLDSVGKGIKDVSAAATMAVTKITEGTLNDEEKNLLVNMGAAVMVIAALGVYVFYKFVSSGKS